MQTEDLVFATYHNAGLRIYDIRDPFQPKEIGYFVPPAPEKIVDQRPNPAKVIQSCDVFVDKEGLMYLTDTNAGPLHPAIWRHVTSQWSRLQHDGKIRAARPAYVDHRHHAAGDRARCRAKGRLRRGRAAPHRFQALLRCRHEQCAGARPHQEERHSGRRAGRRIWLAVRHRRGKQAAVQGVPRDLRERGRARLHTC